MEVYNDKRCVTADELGGIVTYNALRVLVQRGKAERVRRGCYGTPALYAVDSLPYAYRVEVYKRYPDWQAREEARSLIESIVLDGAAAAFFDGHRVNGKSLPSEKRDQYINDASILNAFRELMSRTNALRANGGKRVSLGEFFARAAKALPRIADRYPNTLPQSARRLADKYRDYMRGGYEALVSGKFANSNATKVDEDTKESLIKRLLSDPRNFDNEQIALYYNAVAERMIPAWKTITAGTVANYRVKFDLETSARRRGATEFRNTKTMQVRRRRPEAAMLMWSLDGWDAELYYQAVGKNGRTTYTNRVCVEVVTDVCCNYPIGYAIGPAENTALIKAALKNALDHTTGLFGAMHKVDVLQSDRFQIKAMMPFYAAVADKVVPARAHNAKSKPIERYFLELNKNYCQKLRNWSGFGVTSRRENQPNAEWLAVAKSEFPDLEGVMRQIDAIIAAERAAKHERYMACWARTAQEYRRLMPQQTYLLKFGARTGFRNALEGCGLRVTIDGERYQYDCFDIRFREHANVRWEVRYNPDDLHEALAVNEDETLQFMLEEKYVQPMALAERTEGDAAALKRVNDFNRQLEAEVSERLIRADQETLKIFAHNDRLANTEAKALITDSAGQHKEVRNRKRLKASASAPYIEDVRPVQAVSEEEDSGFNRFDIY